MYSVHVCSSSAMKLLSRHASDESAASRSSRASRTSKKSNSSLSSRKSNRSRSSRGSNGSKQSRQATLFQYGSKLHKLPNTKRDGRVRVIQEMIKPENMYTDRLLPIQCTLCGHRFKTPQALAGHLRSNKHRGA